MYLPPCLTLTYKWSHQHVNVTSLCYMLYPSILRNFGSLFFKYNNTIFTYVQGKESIICFKDGTGKSFPCDHRLSSHGKPGDVNWCSSRWIFLHTGSGYLRFYPGIENLILPMLSYTCCHVGLHTLVVLAQELEVLSLSHLFSHKTKSSQCHYIVTLWDFRF